MEGLLTQKQARWAEERRQLLREFDELKEKHASASTAFRNGISRANTVGSSSSLAPPLQPRKSILRTRSYNGLPSHTSPDSNSANSKRGIHWDTSVSELEIEREKKLRIEASFMSIYTPKSDEDQDKLEAEATPDSSEANSPFDLDKLQPLSVTTQVESPVIDRKRSADLESETSAVNVKNIKLLYENVDSTKSVGSLESPIPLASGRRPRKLSVASSTKSTSGASVSSSCSPLVGPLEDDPVEKQVKEAHIVKVETVEDHVESIAEIVNIKDASDSITDEVTATGETVVKEAANVDTETDASSSEPSAEPRGPRESKWKGLVSRVRLRKSVSSLFQRNSESEIVAASAEPARLEPGERSEAKWRNFFRLSAQ